MASAPKRSTGTPQSDHHEELVEEIDSMGKSEEAINAVRAIEAEVETLRRRYKIWKGQISNLKTEALKKQRELANERKLCRQINAAIIAINHGNKTKEEIIETEKKLCQYFIEQKHEIQAQTAAKLTLMEQKKAEWQKLSASVSEQRQEFERGYLTLPGIMEFKDLKDENKQLTERICNLHSELNLKRAAIATMEQDIRKSEPADQAWNKVCIQFANDWLRIRRMNVEIEQLTSKLDQAKLRRRTVNDRSTAVPQVIPATPAQANKPPMRNPNTFPFVHPALPIDKTLTPAPTPKSTRLVTSPIEKTLTPMRTPVPPRLTTSPIHETAMRTPVSAKLITSPIHETAMRTPVPSRLAAVPNDKTLSPVTPRSSRLATMPNGKALTPVRPPMPARFDTSFNIRLPTTAPTMEMSLSNSSAGSTNGNNSGNIFNFFGLDGSNNSSPGGNDGGSDEGMSFNFAGDGNDDDGDTCGDGDNVRSLF